MNVLVWFKRDLRLHDHPALVMAAGIGPVLPVFVLEPELWAQADASARQWEFVAESLGGLREDLAAIDAPLVVRVGDAVQVLAGLCQRHGIERIVSHAESGTRWTKARDLRVQAWASAAGIEWTELPQPGGMRGPGDEGGAVDALLPAPALRAVKGLEPGLIPTARALKLVADPCPHRQLGHRARGLELLDSFLAQRGEGYRMAAAAPLTAERASSRLSPHLAWGTLSLHEVVQATAVRQADRPGGRWGGALSAFQARLALRGTGMQRPDETSGGSGRDLHPVALAQRSGADTRLAAWAAGETGLPFLDACLRHLRATGWLNARLRGMVASVASHQLGLDWQAVGQHLAQMSTDYDPGIHWPQMQALAGAGLPPPQRLSDPVNLGRALDPVGAFTRRWLPELAGVPDTVLHTPWRWPEARRLLGHRYPEPTIDLATATREARERIDRTRQDAGFAEGPAGTVRRGADRSVGHEAKPRAVRPKLSHAQLSLPF